MKRLQLLLLSEEKRHESFVRETSESRKTIQEIKSFSDSGNFGFGIEGHIEEVRTSYLLVKIKYINTNEILA